jgi:hypothetical protein
MVTTNIWQIEQKPEIIIALGRVTIRWAELDLLLVRIASVALRNTPAGHAAIFGESNAGQARFETFGRIVGASFFSEDERSTILDRLRELRKLYRARNRLTHQPLEGNYFFEQDRLRFQLQFVTRDGKRKDVILNDIECHIGAVDEHLEALEVILETLIETHGFVPPSLDEDQHRQC